MHCSKTISRGWRRCNLHKAEENELRRVEVLSNAYRDANRDAIRLSAAFTPLIRMAILVGFYRRCCSAVGSPSGDHGRRRLFRPGVHDPTVVVAVDSARRNLRPVPASHGLLDEGVGRVGVTHRAQQGEFVPGEEVSSSSVVFNGVTLGTRGEQRCSTTCRWCLNMEKRPVLWGLRVLEKHHSCVCFCVLQSPKA